MIFSSLDSSLMQRALRLAEKGLNTTTPNPRVGCVITNSQGDILGEGYHHRAGSPHAEINALAEAGGHAKGSTVYVTLEPCSHYGKTGPCADALIEAGISRLVYAMEDPNPEVSGKGLERLVDAGIQVDGPLLETEARDLNPGFIKRMSLGLPWVRCKLAMSLDGRTAMASGESKWVTGPAARGDVQKLRARSCAIVTGVDSVLLDDPLLTVRLPECERQPIRIIVDTNVRSPATAEIFQQPGRTVIACSNEKAAAASSFEAWVLPQRDGRVDLYALMRKLSSIGVNEVMLETGATLAGAFVARGLVDELVVYMAAKLMGSSARPLLDLPIKTMGAHLALSIKDIRAVGPDWRITAVPDPDA